MRSHVSAAVSLLLAAAAPAAAQEVALKGGLAISRFAVDGESPFDESMRATTMGGHMRFNFGWLALQPELHVVTRGAMIGAAEEDQTMRLEYLEVPLLVVLPARISDFEVYALGGGMVALETRCRFVFKSEGLRTNAGCDPPTEPLFERRVFDYGVAAGAGISRQLGAGRLLLEGRYTWGLNNIYKGREPTQLRNRTLALMIGYVLAVDPEGS